MPAADPSRYFRGQYRGYREVDGRRARTRETETFVALRLEIDNWRWAGVPFFIRAGKAMPVEATEVRVVFKRPPRLGIGGRMVPDPDELIIRVKPEPGAELCLMAKKAGEDALHRVHLDLLFERAGRPTSPSPTSGCCATRCAATRSCSRTSTRSSRPGASSSRCSTTRPRSSRTSPGSWGPESASHLLTGHGGWRKPWLPE